MDIQQITTHVADAQSNLRSQFKRTNILALVASLVASCQDAEDVAAALNGGTFLQNAFGQTLDKLAANYGVQRLGMTDDVLRSVVMGVVAAAYTQTTSAQVRDIAAKLFCCESVFMKTPDNVDVPSAGRAASLAVGVGSSQLPDSAVSQSVAFMQNALPAGVVLTRVFSFDASSALAMNGSASWVQGLGTGLLASTLYQNPIA